MVIYGSCWCELGWIRYMADQAISIDILISIAVAVAADSK